MPVDCKKCVWNDTESCHGERVVKGFCRTFTDVAGEWKRKIKKRDVKQKNLNKLAEKVFGIESVVEVDEVPLEGFEVKLLRPEPYGINTFIVSTQPEKVLNEYDEVDETGRVWRVKVIK